MKNGIVIISAGVLLVVSGIYWNLKKSPKPAHGVVIGILQTASHPALDQAREGFKSRLLEKLAGKVAFVTHNFEGNIANGLLMAQKLASDKSVKGIFAIATPAAQLAVSVESKKPIFITAVTNPSMLTDDGHVPTNLFGTTDMISIDEQVKAIKTLLPSVRRLGIVYNPGEANATFLHDTMNKTFTAAEFSVVSIGVTSEAELGNQVNAAMSKVDAMIAPTDNLIISVAGFVADMCTKAGIPFMVSDPPSVANGPLFAAGGVDYARSGAVAGEIAARVLEGQSPQEQIINALQSKIVVNRKTMKVLGFDFDAKVVSFVN